ncbi:hypothetical protein D3C80_1456260 [compost metagenome]
MHQPFRLPLTQALQHAAGAGLAQAAAEQAGRQPQQRQANEDEQQRFEHTVTFNIPRERAPIRGAVCHRRG